MYGTGSLLAVKRFELLLRVDTLTLGEIELRRMLLVHPQHPYKWNKYRKKGDNSPQIEYTQ